MTKLLLSVHVLAAIVAVGPVTVAASMFPATLRRALGGSPAGDALVTLRTLHRICCVYAYVGVAVPVFGFATARGLGVLGDTWLIVSMLLTAAAAGVLGLLVLPAQGRALEEAAQAAVRSPASVAPARLAMLTGVFNLLWATVTVLMIVRPGSTTGA
ncbi:DUF2269 family protein [Streptomyces sp. NRRL F-5727]|uniref:DUF2269 family protein n=1 Tax=Streptomyces sp. NRRL F-5727 TaxID=1463871 RepID=UPI0004C4E3AF|nr:DUF2269 family protein [Streptomyces sp. NRRL F-5727]